MKGRSTSLVGKKNHDSKNNENICVLLDLFTVYFFIFLSRSSIQLLKWYTLKQVTERSYVAERSPVPDR